MKYAFKCLILISLFVARTYSQELVPPIQNYAPADYAAASQNWDIAVDDKGIVYTANNQGLLIFDGLSWELFPLESQSIIRSVYPHNGRVYTGSYQEFGYWERSENGSMVYTSLTPLMEEIKMQSDEFWEIISIDDTIYFRSFGAVYQYAEGRITKVENIVSSALGVYKNELILAPRNRGLVLVNSEGETRSLEGDLSLIANLNVIDLESRGDTLFIGGRDAVYIYTDNRIRRFGNSELNRLLKETELNHIISVSETEIILGTIKNGIIQYDLTKDRFQVFNRSSGLQNNTILGLDFSRDRLWVALDKGVDMIDLHAPIHFYTDNTGELGAVYDLHKYQGNFYLASNTGVYSFSNGQLRLIENAGDHTWNLEEIDDVLYANHNTGIYEIRGNKFIPIDTRTGSFSIDKMDESSGNLLVSHYTGISVYNREDATFRELEGLNFPVKNIIFEDTNTIWAAHPYEGIYKISHNKLKELEVEKLESLGDKQNFNPKIYKLNNQVLAYVNNHWYKYNPFQDEFQKFEELKDFSESGLIYKDSNYYVFVNSANDNLIITDLDAENIVLGPKDLNYRLVKSNENFIRENDSIYYVTLNDGFARINLNQFKRKSQEQWISKPFVKEFSDGFRRYSLSEQPNIPFEDSRNITLKAGMPVSRATRLSYALEGEESLSGIMNTGVINFRNLKHGDYTLQLTALGSGMNESTSNFGFSIAPPWYLSVYMKLVYVLVLLLVGFLIYWLNQQKLKRHQLQLEAKFEKEHAERLNRIEKQRLMHAIDLKRKELANTTMMAAKKNEVLMEIQGELSKDKNKFSNQFRLKHIMNKINNAVKNKDEWQVFETNFNEVHEDFFKDVLDQYPKLTSKDLKLCSYLKMNLSSKEIAPLMGISVRGVEVHRYRLRKKMELDSDVNLTKFLIKNF